MMSGVGDGNRTLAESKTNDLNRARVTPNALTEHICAAIVPEWYPDYSLRNRGQEDDIQSQLVTRRPEELRPHPSYVRHRLSVPASRLSALAERGDLVFREPLAITQDNVILDGYALWELARLQGRMTLQCVKYELTQTEALEWLLQNHRRSNGLNDFIRILLALDLEPLLQETARQNQRVGGQNKGSSTLPEADRLDVRSAIASAAGVSVGNVSKVKQLTMTASSEVLQTLRTGEISIHRAWLWSKKTPQEQRDAVRLYVSERGIKKTIRTLLSKRWTKPSRGVLTVSDLVRCLSQPASCDSGPVSVVVIKAPGKFVFVTEETLETSGSKQELPLTCSINSL